MRLRPGIVPAGTGVVSSALDKERKIRRDRLVALSFVGILLLLLYGPGAGWFVTADRVLYDQIATRVPKIGRAHV